MQGLRQAFREDYLRPLRDEDPSGCPGQKNTRGKRQRLGKMGITGLRAQTPPLNWHSKTDLILAGGSYIAEAPEVCPPRSASPERQVPCHRKQTEGAPTGPRLALAQLRQRLQNDLCPGQHRT